MKSFILLLFIYFHSSYSFCSCIHSKEILHSLAAQNMLMYEYSNSFKLNKDQTLENFIYNNNDEKMNKYSKNAINFLSQVSPLGTVELFEDNKETDLQVGITKSDINKRISIIFRGSQSNIDWKYNLMTKKIFLDNKIGVHSGFYYHLHNGDSYDKINDCIIQLINNYPEYDIFITGHSLGGALCTLYGYELSKKVNKTINVVSFASPRLGNTSFKNDIENISNLNILRITNKKDIVTAFPMVNYKHVGITLHLTKNGYEIYDEKNDYCWYKYSLINCNNIKDHDMQNYYKKIINNII
ncbi:hypothetical protein CL656_05640 [bacterium]|nr:hypothetical protein [bacterium]|tara:strand:- start:1686 stop:2579 length:894 start_codon:yes stop_codon:yes gene_type:complete